jgi:hypothetical protein
VCSDPLGRRWSRIHVSCARGRRHITRAPWLVGVRSARRSRFVELLDLALIILLLVSVPLSVGLLMLWFMVIAPRIGRATKHSAQLSAEDLPVRGQRPLPHRAGRSRVSTQAATPATRRRPMEVVGRPETTDPRDWR